MKKNQLFITQAAILQWQRHFRTENSNHYEQKRHRQIRTGDKLLPDKN